MTPNEFFATELFGWSPAPMKEGYSHLGVNIYTHPKYGWVPIYKGSGIQYSLEGEMNHEWPNIHDDRLLYYWINLIEKKLAEKNLLINYVNWLDSITFIKAENCDELTWRESAILNSTTDQKIYAAIQTLKLRNNN